MSFTNQVAIDGNLVRDGEITFTGGGTAVLNFSIAHNAKINNKEEVHYLDVVAFGKHAEYVADFAVKGATVTVIGRINQDRWEKDGKKYSRIKIVGNQCVFGKVKTAAAKQAQPISDEDIPF